MPNSFKYQAAPTDKSAFHALLIERTSAWCLVPFVETVGANLCQNFYFLLKNGPSLCLENEVCEENIGAILCVLDLFASGIQNTYQRFWKSWEWAWIPHLSNPTAIFINTLKNVLNENKKAKMLIVYLSQKDLKKIEAQDKSETETSRNKIYKKFAKQCSLDDSLELLSAYFKVDILLITNPENTLNAPFSQADIALYNTHAIAERHITHFNYSLDFTIETRNDLIQTNPLTLTLLVEHLKTRDLEYLSLMHQQARYCELLGELLHPFNVFSSVFLGLFPYMILMFQTIGMLYNTKPKEIDNNIFLANLICILGIRFGLGKGTVNNALRREMAEKNLKKFGHWLLYQEGASFFITALLNTFFGMMFFTPFSWNPKKGAYYIIPALLRLLGITVGISISLFYLYVALFTQVGIELLIKTFMRDFNIKDNALIEAYDYLRFTIDLVCVISSLSYNGLLTQYIESCNKCDAIAKRFEHWIAPPGKTFAEILFRKYVDQNSSPAHNPREQYKNFREQLQIIINTLPPTAPLWQTWFFLWFHCDTLSAEPNRATLEQFGILYENSNKNNGGNGARSAHDLRVDLLNAGLSSDYFKLDQQTQEQVFKTRDDMLYDVNFSQHLSFYYSLSCNPHASLETQSMFTRQSAIQQKDPHLERILNSLNTAHHTSEENTPFWVHIGNLGDIAVFGMSATFAIAGLFAISLKIDSMPFLASIASGLIKISAALILGISAGLANLIFTYAAAAPGQMKAWSLLSKAIKQSSCVSSCTFFFCGSEADHSITTPLLDSVGSLPELANNGDRSPTRPKLDVSPTAL